VLRQVSWEDTTDATLVYFIPLQYLVVIPILLPYVRYLMIQLITGMVSACQLTWQLELYVAKLLQQVTLAPVLLPAQMHV